jgi:predicted GH43/DUF377 family glycosyl hydrolase
MAIRRFDSNPLLTPDDVEPTQEGLEIFCTLNPAAVRCGDEVLLLVRVGEKPIDEPGYVASLEYDPQADRLRTIRISRDDPDLDASDPRKLMYKGKFLLTSLSHLRLARSSDGGRTFSFDPAPAIFPSTPYEAFGCEDARITWIDGRYLIAYTAVSSRGVAVALAQTHDFTSFEKLAVIFPPYQKDVCVFPEKIHNHYVCRHRPYRSDFNDACIWTAFSPDLLSWGRHEWTFGPEAGTWEANRVGAGPPPVKTPEGWLEIYHAADATGRYALGAMLTDLEHPQRLISRSRTPVMEPETDYELRGVYSRCVFCNGMIADDDGTLTIYYGAADRVCAGATTTVHEMLAAAKNEA